MHEIHRPHLVQRLRHRQRLGLLTHHALLRPDPQVQFEASIDPIDPLVIPSVALHVSQVQEAQAEPPVAIVLCEADQPIGDLGVLRLQLGLVAIAAFTDPERHAGQRDRQPLLGDRSSGNLTQLR